MRVAKSSLAGLLMEDGEEVLAARLACSDLPDELDTVTDADGLDELGLDADALESLLPAHSSDIPGSAIVPAGGRDLEQTISDRWAELVQQWTHARPAEL